MHANTPEALLSGMVRFAQRFEFERIGAMVVVDRSPKVSEFFVVDNAPEPIHTALEDLDIRRRDPVMQHCKRSSLPIAWGQATYTAAGMGDVWEEQAPYGYGHGIAMAVHLPKGRHFMLGADGGRRLPDDPHQLLRLVADLQLLATCAHEAAARIFAPQIGEEETPALTRPELDTLRWTMEGKTAWEVGQVLSLSQRTTVMHLNNAMRKLGCVSKHQAVLKALRMGMFQG